MKCLREHDCLGFALVWRLFCSLIGDGKRREPSANQTLNQTKYVFGFGSGFRTRYHHKNVFRMCFLSFGQVNNSISFLSFWSCEIKGACLSMF